MNGFTPTKSKEKVVKKRVCTHLLAQCGRALLVEILSLVCHFGCLQLARFEIVIPLKPPFTTCRGHRFQQHSACYRLRTLFLQMHSMLSGAARPASKFSIAESVVGDPSLVCSTKVRFLARTLSTPSRSVPAYLSASVELHSA